MSSILFARRGLRAYLPFLFVAGVLSLAAYWQASLPTNDVYHYQCYATAFWTGDRASPQLGTNRCTYMDQFVQFHTFPPEYPPFSLIYFSLPLLLPWASYPFAFALLILLAFFATYQLLLRYGPDGSPAAFAFHLMAAALIFGFMRYDLIPAGLTLLAVILAERRRWKLAYLILAIAGLSKVFPLVLFPILFLSEQAEGPRAGTLPRLTEPAGRWEAIRWRVGSLRWKNSLVFIAMFLGTTLAFEMLALSHQAFTWLDNLFTRPFQAESLGSSLIWASSWAGLPVSWKMSFGSLNILSPIAGGIGRGLFILMVVGYLWILVQQARGKLNIVQACLAALFVLLVGGKIFSPQYLIWIVPLLALSGSNKPAWFVLWGLVATLTDLDYAFYGLNPNSELLPGIPGFLLVILVRNALFLLMALAYLFNWFGLRQPERDIYKNSTQS